MYTIVEKKLGHKEGQRYRSTMQALYVVAACSSHDEAMSNSEEMKPVALSIIRASLGLVTNTAKLF